MIQIRSFSGAQQGLAVAIAFIIIAFSSLSHKSQWQSSFARNHQKTPRSSYVISVRGSVSYPGIYLFDQAPTVSEAIQKAGGPSKRIIVEASQYHMLKSGTLIEVTNQSPETAGAVISAMDPKTSFILGLPLDLNQADADALSLAPGISDRLANRIVSYRNTHGPFETWQDLDQVKGLGMVKIARLKDELRIGSPPPDLSARRQ